MWAALAPQAALVAACFLEVFSGSGHLARSVAKSPLAGGLVLLWDISFGPQYDLRARSRQHLILGWLRAGLIWGVHFGTPCCSFSRARDVPPGPPPLRSDQCPMGLPGLVRAADKEAVQSGNTLMLFSVRALRVCRDMRIPATLENPARSRLWLCPAIRGALKWRLSTLTTTEFCMWGRPWRKPTAFLGVHADLTSVGARRCLGAKRGCCARTGRPHLVLQGSRSGCSMAHQDC